MTIQKGQTAKALDRWVELFKPAFRGAVVATHEGRVDAAEIKRLSVKLPAIYVAALSAPASADVGDDTHTYDTVFSAYILTGGQQRDRAGLNMSEAVRILVKTSVSKTDGVGKARRITWSNVFSNAAIGQGLSLNAVAWRQTIQLGTQSAGVELFTNGLLWPDGVVPDSLYIEHDGVTENGTPNPPG